MRQVKILLVVFVWFLSFNCKKATEDKTITTDTVAKTIQKTVTDSHRSSNSLDWEGTYKGIVPCADCEGIQTVISLNKDLTYEKTTIYLGKDDATKSVLKGNFYWKEDGLHIVLQGISNAPNQYLVGENKLFQLDMDGNRITDNLAENYQLQKEK